MSSQSFSQLMTVNLESLLNRVGGVGSWVLGWRGSNFGVSSVGSVGP